MSRSNQDSAGIKTIDQVKGDIQDFKINNQYHALLDHKGSVITLLIDFTQVSVLDIGIVAGDVSSQLNAVQFTSLKAGLNKGDDFMFALHDESLFDKVGKVFGMEDIKIDYQEFDKEIILSTNNAARVKKIFSDEKMRLVFQSLSSFSLQLKSNDDEAANTYMLEFMINRAILNEVELGIIYEGFTSILDDIVITQNEKI